MAAANASLRGQRVAILASPLPELTGLYLAVDCQSGGCGGGGGGERTFAVSDLANFYSWNGRRRAAADAVQGRLWRARRRRVAGDGTYPQCEGAAASVGVAREVPPAAKTRAAALLPRLRPEQRHPNGALLSDSIQSGCATLR